MEIIDLIKYMIKQQPALLAVMLVLLASLPTDFSNNTLKAVVKTVVIVVALILQLKASLNQMLLYDHMKLKLNYFEKVLFDRNITEKQIKDYKEIDELFNKYSKLNSSKSSK